MGRNAHRRSRPGPAPAITDADFHARLSAQLGSEVEGLEEALRTTSPVSIRVNRGKWSGPTAEPVPWCAEGRYLGERPSFTFDPLLHAGCYYVQEAGSMLLEQAVRATGLVNGRIAALDLCAAPGGKSTHLRSLLHPDALLVSNEIDHKRAAILQENLWKWGAANCVVTNAAPSRFAALEETFDLIVVDAPCSGEGMFRKDAFARTQWSAALVEQCGLMQHDALEQTWGCLKPGGFLIYSTCTWEVAENEAQVARLIAMGGKAIGIPVDDAWGMVRSTREGVDALRCYPHRVRGEGFFIALVQKPGELSPAPATRDPGHTDDAPWLRPTRAWRTIEINEERYAIDESWSGVIERIRAALPTWSAGIPYGERKGDGWRPHTALALAQDLDRSPFTEIPLDRTEAIALLRGNALPARDAHGIGLATYHGIALCWMQGAGNRWNNRWPATW
ncbi:MAG: RsmB/NOP family class I SAM-dependent RNA methyltransferase, partial [Flavobacteriales bacterium]|nr:RsmB/NOP family class I SAM-dependent RNA methyltransferase [Flavobacteriales bacterium]